MTISGQTSNVIWPYMTRLHVLLNPVIIILWMKSLMRDQLLLSKHLYNFNVALN